MGNGIGNDKYMTAPAQRSHTLVPMQCAQLEALIRATILTGTGADPCSLCKHPFKLASSIQKLVPNKLWQTIG
jgi:hypothetical protein